MLQDTILEAVNLSILHSFFFFFFFLRRLSPVSIANFGRQRTKKEIQTKIPYFRVAANISPFFFSSFFLLTRTGKIGKMWIK